MLVTAIEGVSANPVDVPVNVPVIVVASTLPNEPVEVELPLISPDAVKFPVKLILSVRTFDRLLLLIGSYLQI